MRADLLVGKPSVLAVIIRLHVEAIAQAVIEIPSYLRHDSDILGLEGVEGYTTRHRSDVVEGSELSSFTRLRGGEDG